MLSIFNEDILKKGNLKVTADSPILLVKCVWILEFCLERTVLFYCTTLRITALNY